jgi:hypothetical protein
VGIPLLSRESQTKRGEACLVAIEDIRIISISFPPDMYPARL